MKANIQIQIDSVGNPDRYLKISRALRQLSEELEQRGFEYQSHVNDNGQRTLLFEIVNQDLEEVDEWPEDDE